MSVSKDFVEQTMEYGGYALHLRRTPYQTYQIVLTCNRVSRVIVDEDANFVRIDAVFSFLRRKVEVWPSFFQGENDDVISNR